MSQNTKALADFSRHSGPDDLQGRNQHQHQQQQHEPPKKSHGVSGIFHKILGGFQEATGGGSGSAGGHHSGNGKNKTPAVKSQTSPMKHHHQQSFDGVVVHRYPFQESSLLTSPDRSPPLPEKDHLPVAFAPQQPQQPQPPPQRERKKRTTATANATVAYHSLETPNSLAIPGVSTGVSTGGGSMENAPVSPSDFQTSVLDMYHSMETEMYGGPAGSFSATGSPAAPSSTMSSTLGSPAGSGATTATTLITTNNATTTTSKEESRKKYRKSAFPMSSATTTKNHRLMATEDQDQDREDLLLSSRSESTTGVLSSMISAWESQTKNATDFEDLMAVIHRFGATTTTTTSDATATVEEEEKEVPGSSSSHSSSQQNSLMEEIMGSLEGCNDGGSSSSPALASVTVAPTVQRPRSPPRSSVHGASSSSPSPSSSPPRSASPRDGYHGGRRTTVAGGMVLHRASVIVNGGAFRRRTDRPAKQQAQRRVVFSGVDQVIPFEEHAYVTAATAAHTSAITATRSQVVQPPMYTQPTQQILPPTATSIMMMAMNVQGSYAVVSSVLEGNGNGDGDGVDHYQHLLVHDRPNTMVMPPLMGPPADFALAQDVRGGMNLDSEDDDEDEEIQAEQVGEQVVVRQPTPVKAQALNRASVMGPHVPRVPSPLKKDPVVVTVPDIVSVPTPVMVEDDDVTASVAQRLAADMDDDMEDDDSTVEPMSSMFGSSRMSVVVAVGSSSQTPREEEQEEEVQEDAVASATTTTATTTIMAGKTSPVTPVPAVKQRKVKRRHIQIQARPVEFRTVGVQVGASGYGGSGSTLIATTNMESALQQQQQQQQLRSENANLQRQVDMLLVEMADVKSKFNTLSEQAFHKIQDLMQERSALQEDLLRWRSSSTSSSGNHLEEYYQE